MKKIIVAAAVLALALVGCDPVKSGACDQIGSQATDSHGQLFTCVKNEKTGKGYWYEGKP